MKISYAITVCNELEEIKRLVDFLLPNKRIQDEIVILYDNKNGDERILDYLLPLNIKPNVQTWRGLWFEGHFGDWKNLLTSYCTGDYIFQIDADEMIGEYLVENLPLILEANPEVDVFLTPRINTVEGLTQEHINKWRWNVNDKGWVNFPDYQWRIYKNSPNIKWKNKVHEVLDGYKTTALLPADEGFCLLHPKTIDRQEKQNNYYDTL
jgi:hypothetical protein